MIGGVWVTGLFTLLGVGLGAVVTQGAAFTMKRRDEKRERERIRRLLVTELRTIFTHLFLVIKHGGGSLPERPAAERPEGFIPTAIWLRYQERFADPTVATADEWDAVDTAYDAIAATRYGLFAGTSYPRGEIEDVMAKIEGAAAQLGFPEPTSS